MKNRNIITTKEVFYSLMDRKTGPIPISELIKEMAKITNQTVAAVEWTTFKSTKWFCQDWFLKNFDTTKSGRNRSVFWKKNTGIEKIEKIINYDSNERETVRYFTLGDVLRIENPVVAINCSSDGYDAQLLLELNPKTTIHNIEVKKKVLKEYEKKGYKTINHKMSVEKFFHINNIHFDIIWIDCYCYVCKPLWNTLRDINIKKSTEYLFVTLKSTKGMRMKDYFSSAMKIKFKDSKELQKDIIDDVLSNYVYVDSYKGPSSLKGSNQKMTFLKYVRNTGNKNKNTKHSIERCVKLWKENNISEKGEFKKKFYKEYIYLSLSRNLEEFYKGLGLGYKTDPKTENNLCSCGRKREKYSSKCDKCLSEKINDRFEKRKKKV